MSTEFDASKDYYVILGVTDTATIDELKTARKTLVLQYHPDVNPSEDAAIKFRGIQGAYEVLSDASTRAKYDAERNRLIFKDVSLSSGLSTGYLTQQNNFNTIVKKAASSNWQELAQNRIKTPAWQGLPLASKKLFRASKTRSGLVINAFAVSAIFGIIAADQLLVPRLQMMGGEPVPVKRSHH